MNRTLAAACLAVLVGAPIAADAAEPTTLRFGFTSPKTSYVFVYGAEPWIKEVEAASQGTLKIQMFFSNALGTVFNIYQRTVDGVVDLSFGTIGTLGGVFPTCRSRARIPTRPPSRSGASTPRASPPTNTGW
jgi:TRAP-type C4-dicarboxylate transport system substrate-binding protein